MLNETLKFSIQFAQYTQLQDVTLRLKPRL